MEALIDINDAAAALHSQLCDATEAEADAARALGEAQLAAVQKGVAVPGKLVTDLEAARRRRSQLEAALEAADRAQAAGAVAKQSSARQVREQEVAAVLDELVAAADEVTTALRQFQATQAGSRCMQAMNRLLAAAGGMHASFLTPNGWAVADGVTLLRERHRDGVAQFAADAMHAAMRDEAPDALTRFVLDLRRRLVRDAAAQPADWPAGR